MARAKPKPAQPAVLVDGEVIRQIRQHARSCSKTEVCGVLIGNEDKNGMHIEACIAGLNAAQAGTHVTFTQDTWEHIYKTKDRDFPEQRIVGWYHSHPGFGVFLSDHDTFIHKNFFSSPTQVAWVYDPHSDEEGCFGWVGERIERLSEIAVSDRKGGEGAGETGKPEPVGAADDSQDDDVQGSMRQEPEAPVWLRWTSTILSYILVLAIGFFVSWLLFPREVIILVNPYNGTAVEAPPGTRINSDGTITLPRIPELEKPQSEKDTKPSTPDSASAPQPAPKTDSAKDKDKDKDKDVPRK
jgi:proteasome lid subunit RPN8/RPN11